MILLMDVGNTRTKWHLYQDGEWLQGGAISRDASIQLPELADAPSAVWVASVAGAGFEEVLSSQVAGCWQLRPWFPRSPAAELGLISSYSQPARMGVDRWLAMLAAWQPRQKRVCVVDAGSALTIDFVAADGEHLGGFILPGLDSMERALLSDTDRVRFADAPRDSIAPGRCTEEAVYNGLLLSQAGAVALALQQQTDHCELVFSGGNGAALQAVLERGGHYAQDLVLQGLLLSGQGRQ